MNTYLGIDYGGTKLLIGEVDERGNLLKYRKFPTGITGQQEMAEHLLKCLADYAERERVVGRIKAAGIGIVGVSDFETGMWMSVNHKPATPIPLADLVSKLLHVPVGIDNDVRSATTAELLWGSGKTCRNFVYVNAGTGLAAGLVTDGRLIRGGHRDAGEIGHLVVDMNSSRRCICGRYGCAELSASGIGLHMMSEQLREGKRTELPPPEKGERTPAALIFELAGKGDPFCEELAETAAKTLGTVIMNLVRTTDPELVIMGGGLMSNEWFFRKVESMLEPVTMRHVSGGVKRSIFDPAFTGLIGAAAVGSEKIKGEEK